MPRDVDPNELTPSQPDDHQNIELNKADGRHHEQIHRGDLRRMIAQERAPGLAGRIILLVHVLSHGRLSYRKAQFEKFSLNAWRAPKHILPAHAPD
jgi:hypothetical protein